MSVNKKLDAKFIDDVKYLVEATRCENGYLWQEYNETGFSTENTGIHVILGELGGMPVCINMSIGMYKNVKFVTYEATSVVVDYRMIQEFFDYHYDEVNQIDAMNFGQVVNAAVQKEGIKYLQYNGVSTYTDTLEVFKWLNSHGN